MAAPVTTSPVRSARDRTDGRALARLWWRLTRRGAIVLALMAATWAATEVASYTASYPDTASRVRLASMMDTPAVRMLQGIPTAIGTTGGYVAWDAGWVLCIVLGVWALITTSRLLRGEEETDRIGLVLAAPFRAHRVLLVQVLVLVGGCALFGAALTLAMVLLGTPLAGAVLFGAATAGFGATFVAITAVAAQLVGVRRRVVAVVGTLLGAAYVLRMIANSTDGRGWLRWATPFGWVDEVHAYGDNRWWALAPTLVTSVLLVIVALRLRVRRDASGALLPDRSANTSRLRFLGGPTAFAWRSTRGVLWGWAIGLGAYGFVVGTLTTSMTTMANEDESYRRALEAVGMGSALTPRGFIAVMGNVFAVAFALFACWRIGAPRAEEAAEHADMILTRPVTRRRWLGGHVVLALSSLVFLAVVCAVALWAGAAVTGSDVALSDALAATLNTLPVAALCGAVAVLLLGAVPRLTVPVSIALTVIWYLLALLGPGLDWPDPVLNLSPFHHLAVVPIEAFATTATLGLTGLALLAVGTGLAIFERRDVAGA